MNYKSRHRGVTASLSLDEFARLERLAKSEGKGVCVVARDLIREALDRRGS
jgi:hypothetical protein